MRLRLGTAGVRLRGDDGVREALDDGLVVLDLRRARALVREVSTGRGVELDERGHGPGGVGERGATLPASLSVGDSELADFDVRSGPDGPAGSDGKDAAGSVDAATTASPERAANNERCFIDTHFPVRTGGVEGAWCFPVVVADGCADDRACTL